MGAAGAAHRAARRADVAAPHEDARPAVRPRGGAGRGRRIPEAPQGGARCRACTGDAGAPRRLALARSRSCARVGRRVRPNPPAQKGPGAADAGALARAGGSGLAVLGSMYRHDDGIEFHAQITDEVHGRILHTLDPVLGDPREPRPALTLLRERIMAALAAAVDSRLGALASAAGQPPRYDAYLAFSAGVEIFYGGRRARGAMPDFPPAPPPGSTHTPRLILAARGPR